MITGRSWGTTGTRGFSRFLTNRFCIEGYEWIRVHIPGAKAQFFVRFERPKAKALGYLGGDGDADTYYLAGFGFLGGDPLGGAGVEHVERECAAA
jgi:hypothetical protein